MEYGRFYLDLLFIRKYLLKINKLILKFNK